jgi:hypothetical protein
MIRTSEKYLMKLNQLCTVILIIALVAVLSGCVCCFGMDGMLSKLKKPVSAIKFPSTLTIGGKTYNRVYANEYLDPASARAGLKSFAGKLGYGTDLQGLIDKGIDLSGIKQYKSFKYSDGTQKGTLGGAVAKTDAPSTVTGGYEAIKGSVNAGMGSVNDPGQNTGNVQNVAPQGSTELGNGGDRYTMTVNGQPCYVIVVKYSNLYITAYSFESFAADEAAINMAIQQIEEAAST